MAETSPALANLSKWPARPPRTAGGVRRVLAAAARPSRAFSPGPLINSDVMGGGLRSGLFMPASGSRLTSPSDQATDAHEHGAEQANPRFALCGQQLQLDEGSPQEEANTHVGEQAAPEVRGVERPLITHARR